MKGNYCIKTKMTVEKGNYNLDTNNDGFLDQNLKDLMKLYNMKKKLKNFSDKYCKMIAGKHGGEIQCTIL